MPNTHEARPSRWKRARRNAMVVASSMFAIAGAGLAMTAGRIGRTGVDPVLHLEASLSERTLTVLKNGEVLATYSVSVGTDRHPTPHGSFGMRKVVWNPGWVPPRAKWARGLKAKEPWHPANPMKMVKIFFREPDYYIHGTPYTASLGKAESHGCLRMAPDNAAEVARMVMEHGGAEREPGWFDEVLSIGRTRTVLLPSPVQLTIVQ